jgi:peptidoglycan/xylan/chitin deacetylase (PgdA/CDA1 family)
MKQRLISAGLGFFRATGLDRATSSLTRGRGVILMFHNVRQRPDRAFLPNQSLEVTPEFFELTLDLLDREGYEIVPISEVGERIAQSGGKRIAALTFDDGYRDNLEVAAPILRRRNAPYAVYVTTGFIERTARVWWSEVEACIEARDHVEMRIGDDVFSHAARTLEEKHAAYIAAYAFLRAHDEPDMLDAVARLLDESGIAPGFNETCMTWDEVRTLSKEPMCTIGAHTVTHARLMKHTPERVHSELADSKRIIEREIGMPVDHFAYPYGDAGSAGPREFRIAKECGFATAITTRPGMLFEGHKDHMTALPRLAVHGAWQDMRALESLMTGAPFALWNMGRKVNVG